MAENQDNPGVIAHPPLIYLGAIVLAGALEATIPLGRGIFAAPLWAVIGGNLLMTGAVAILAWAMHRFVTAGTNVPTHLPSTKIVTDGPYAHSRNPIYVALTAFYLGLSLALDIVWGFLLVPGVLVVMHYGVVLREEAYLARKFPAEFAAYSARVRRWL